MALKEREQAILEYLKDKREASVGELCKALFVSEPTMRRDLATLNKAGKIIRTHGGATFRRDISTNIPLSFREKEHSDAKIVIARKCLALIKDGDTIMTDSSSSALALLKILPARANIVIITNSAKAAVTLADRNLKVFVTGGELTADSFAYTGGYAMDFLRSFNADWCFFSVRTLSLSGLLTDNAIAENDIRRVMLARSTKKVLMLDSGKVGEPCLNTLCSINEIDFVVSEQNISPLFPAHSEKFL